MAKVTKGQLKDAMDNLRYSINNHHAAVGPQEKAQAKDFLKRSGLKLMKLLEQDLNVYAQKLRQRAESMVDQSTTIITA